MKKYYFEFSTGTKSLFVNATIDVMNKITSNQAFMAQDHAGVDVIVNPRNVLYVELG